MAGLAPVRASGEAGAFRAAARFRSADPRLANRPSSPPTPSSASASAGPRLFPGGASASPSVRRHRCGPPPVPARPAPPRPAASPRSPRAAAPRGGAPCRLDRSGRLGGRWAGRPSFTIAGFRSGGRHVTMLGAEIRGSFRASCFCTTKRRVFPGSSRPGPGMRAKSRFARSPPDRGITAGARERGHRGEKRWLRWIGRDVSCHAGRRSRTHGVATAPLAGRTRARGIIRAASGCRDGTRRGVNTAIIGTASWKHVDPARGGSAPSGPRSRYADPLSPARTDRAAPVEPFSSHRVRP